MLFAFLLDALVLIATASAIVNMVKLDHTLFIALMIISISLMMHIREIVILKL